MLDSIRYYLAEPPSFMAKFDSRHSFISSRHGRIFGIKAGLDHGGKVQYGLGLNWLNNTNDFARELKFGDSTVSGALKFWFISPFFEYTFFENPHWELSMPVRIGAGAARFTYRDPLRDKRIERKRTVFTYEPVLTAQYKFWRYFGIGAGVGYRIIGIDPSLIPKRFDQEPYRFSSPIYIFRFKVFFGKMYRDVFPKKE